MSHDARFPAHRLMRRVNRRTKTPIPATILVLVVGVVLMIVLPGAALLELTLASTIIPFLLYGVTIVLYLAVRRRLDHKPGAFDLGRFELPIAIAALVWILLSLFVLMASGTVTQVLVVAGLIAAGAIYVCYLLKFKSGTLDNEPGLADAFEI